MVIKEIELNPQVNKYYQSRINMIKTALIIFLALFFFTSGLNHFFNPHILQEYMKRRKYKHAKFLVISSGLLLFLAGPALLIAQYNIRVYASYALAVFVLLAAFMVHSFWQETDKHHRMLESQHCIKNLVIFFEMLYLGSTF
jgi:putative oxidoreductase